MSLPCPRCRQPLARAPRGSPVEWSCAPCGGSALRLHRLRRAAPAEFADAVEAAAAVGGRRGETRCFVCQMHFVALRPRVGVRAWALDFCDECGIVWFDRGEAEAARDGSAPPPPDEWHDRRSSVPRFASSNGGADPIEFEADFPRGSLGRQLPLWAGLPTVSEGTTWSRPWITWGAMAAVAATSLFALAAGIEAVAREWAFVPAEAFRRAGTGFATSALCHDDVVHLLVNLYFLALLGPRTEDLLRPGRYALLLLLSVVGGNLLYLAVSPESRVPALGAGPAITGVLAFFALSWPSARFRQLDWVWFRPLMYEASARTALVIWVGINAARGLLLSAGRFGIPEIAHLGAAAVGAGFWLLDRGSGAARPVAGAVPAA
jgi:membrane associated rhomboid family serine protease